MRVGVIGINHKLADLKLREILAKTCQKRFGPDMSIHGGHAFVLLSTCNRTEIYFSSDDLVNTHSYLLNILLKDIGENSQKFDQKLYSYFGIDCFLHLARVTSGLDSAIVAETEIQGQVKSAYESAARFSKLPKEIHFMFQKSLKIGKQIRSEKLIDRSIPSLEHAVLNMGHHLFQDPSKAKILFIGASEINRKILTFLKRKKNENITICNRSQNVAKEWVTKYSLGCLSWENLNKWTDYDWVIFGTKSPDYILDKTSLPNESMNHKLILDLCVPRNVDPKIGRDPRMTLYNIDQINKSLKMSQKRMNHILSSAELSIMSSIKRHILIFKEKEKFRNKLALAL